MCIVPLAKFGPIGCFMRKLHWHISSHSLSLQQIFTCLDSKCSTFQDLTRFQPYMLKHVVEEHWKDEFATYVNESDTNLILWDHHSACETCFWDHHAGARMPSAVHVSISTAMAVQKGLKFVSIETNLMTTECCSCFAIFRVKFS